MEIGYPDQHLATPQYAESPNRGQLSLELRPTHILSFFATRSYPAGAACWGTRGRPDQRKERMFTPIKKVLAGLAALAALALGGSAIASAASSSTTSSTSPSTSGAQSRPAFRGPAHGTAAHEDAEKTVTGASAAKARAAAVKSVGSGTAGAVTTDFTGNGFETTVTKSDGSKVEVHLDSSYQVSQGPGGHGGPPSGGRGGPGAPPSGGYGA
jgi:hypothetical protein